MIFPALTIGVVFYLYQTRDTETDTAIEVEQSPLPVRIQAVVSAPLEIAVMGFGRVDPIATWQAVSQVSGRVVSLPSDFSTGTILDENVEAVAIDPRDYEIALAKARANLATARADLEELNVEELNTVAQVGLEEQVEAFLQSEYDRKASLVQSGASTQATLEQANRDLLKQQRTVLDLRNQVALYPVQRVSIDATIKTREVEVEEAERNLALTKIQTPFRGRISNTSLNIGEFVSVGATLLELDDVSAAEISAAFQPSDLTRALRAIVPASGMPDIEAGNGGEAVNFLKSLGFKAFVQQKVGDVEHQWPADLIRFSGTADTSTGAVDLVVRVENPRVPDPETGRPPLNTGSFVEVVLARPGDGDVIAVPRAALQYTGDGATFVYTLSGENTLARADIMVQSIVADQAIVSSGLNSGDVVVLSDPQPAILGMALAPVAQD